MGDGLNPPSISPEIRSLSGSMNPSKVVETTAQKYARPPSLDDEQDLTTVILMNLFVIVYGMNGKSMPGSGHRFGYPPLGGLIAAIAAS